MFLYFLRHGDAETDPSVPGENHSLSDDGIRQIRNIAALIGRLGLRFDAAFTSPLLRACQSADIVVGTAQSPSKIVTTEYLIPGSDPQKLFRLLEQQPDSAHILLVGHEPLLGQLVAFMVAENLTAEVDMKKGSLCCLEIARPIKPGSGLLKWLIPAAAAR